jgi:energy-coupling factor transporter transmembrane protein EcfT
MYYLFRKAGCFRSFALAFALMLSFIPRFFEVWDDTHSALRARCGKASAWQILTVVLPLVCERMIEKAIETAAALEARGAA